MIKTSLFYRALPLYFAFGNSCHPPVIAISPLESTEVSTHWMDGESAYLQHRRQYPEALDSKLLSIQGQWIDRNGIGQWTFVFGPPEATPEATGNTNTYILRHFADLRHQWQHLLSPFSEQRHVYWTPQTGWQSGILSTEGMEP